MTTYRNDKDDSKDSRHGNKETTTKQCHQSYFLHFWHASSKEHGKWNGDEVEVRGHVHAQKGPKQGWRDGRLAVD